MKKIIIFLISLNIFLISGNLEKLKQEAKAGNKEALMQLGFIYENARGVKKDLNLAKKYYSQAAELGSEDAQVALSLLQLSASLDKKGVSLNNSVTIKDADNLNLSLSVNDLQETLQKAKNLDKDALYTLAVIYDNGLGDIKRDFKRAIALYKKAAKLGSLKAKRVLELKLANLKDKK
jgi:TPR repeat protein